MKISLNWIREFTDIKCTDDELVQKIGAQLGEVEEVVRLGEQYKDIVVAKVISCEKHPNADKLSVCKIDDGGKTPKVKRDNNGLVQVVCGAPNVRAGIHIAWIPPGAIVPSTYNKEQFKLDVRPLRGVDSNGMIASGSELAMNDDHSGILIIDKPAKPGTPLAEIYQLNDVIIDIENKMFTHRPDCFGILGVAREIAGIQGIKFSSPDWYLKSLDVLSITGPKLKLSVENEIPDLVPRFMAVAMSNVKVTKSPIAMQSYLYRVGIKPVNNVVDVTNFVMMLTAQPLHAFDYDKVAAQDNADHATIVVRKPKKGEKIALLNGKTIEPRSEAIMIASKKRLLAVGGVMGGADTEVDENTKNIILECANFDMYSIRRTSMEHGLFTDAVTRFNKGQSALQNDRILAYAIAMLQKHASVEFASGVIDIHKKLQLNPIISITEDFINQRLGTELSKADVTKILNNVEFDIKTNNDLQITAPFWRTDIEISEDIVEEVGRLYGYDHLPLTLPKRTTKPASRNEMIEFKNRIRNLLSSTGANEVLTYSFVHSKLLEAVGQDIDQAFKLSNALSPDLQYYRLSLTPSLLDKVHANIKANYDEFAMYELNKVHNKQDKDPNEPTVPDEKHRLAVVYAAKNSSIEGASYFQAKRQLDSLLSALNISVEVQPLTENYAESFVDLKAWLSPFEPGRSALITVKSTESEIEAVLLGVVGEFKQSIAKNLKLPKFCAGFELDTELLNRFASTNPYQALQKFPKTQQDISFKVSAKTTYKELFDCVWQQLVRSEQEHGYNTSLAPIDIYQAKYDDKHKTITMHIELNHPDRTLTTQEFNTLLEQIASSTQQSLSAERV